MQIITAARGIILHEDKILVFRLRKDEAYCSLPGGRIDPGETITNAIVRELEEETAIPAKLGELAYVHDLVKDEKHKTEFFFWIENPKDYKNLDLSKATHGYEVYEALWINIKNPEIEIRPHWLLEELQEGRHQGAKLRVSSS